VSVSGTANKNIKNSLNSGTGYSLKCTGTITGSSARTFKLFNTGIGIVKFVHGSRRFVPVLLGLFFRKSVFGSANTGIC